MNIVTRGLGKLANLITKGYSKTLVIVVKKGGGTALPIPFIDYKEVRKGIFKHIKTRTINVPDVQKDITVDVLLIKHTGDISVTAILNSVKEKYTEVKVYLENEVRIR